MYIQSILNPARKYYQQASNNKQGNINFQAPRPCDRCRKHRIKCDRSLLGCSHCTKNSILCEYKYIPKKRGPKSKLERDCSYLSAINKKYNDQEQACMLSPDSSTIGSTNNTTQLGEYVYTPIQQFSQAEKFGFESINLNLPVPPPIPPILISQYFPQIHSPPSLNATALGSSDHTQELNNMSLSPNTQALSVAFSPNPQVSSAAFSPNPQESYLQTTTAFNHSTQDLSLAISPELNQYIFETPTLSQDAFQTPPTTLIDSYITPADSLSSNYWLPLPSSYFTSAAGHSADNFQLSPDLSPVLL
ncbi:hypothetical protein CONCODRAFT_86991 [Conidiobolus coronatus NRRL 28638]|uniref:Zn(2)-C6 fungal-type domain-containing protein n=1 Tax=Conidiobolus coronatus (strain ATCC 28846 / CBS 209.66 / NRRL 28638) TaxID=796925 RepID=A0A137NXE2_CONC2|nr:hypothetical protein CONCODRAFT_86991 [Conidiobolus coronatus NRRL 28638]|eukprot:KXN67382.1 hypothetical protein CONCODRAFT_86991 [Conidiobolus coronatus NRRL 28638]